VKALRVVLADDHLIVRQALKALLEQAGIRVVADEADGVAAVAAVRKHAPDMVVLDVAMPLLNGVDAAREITRSDPHPDVILLSGLDDTRFVPEALQAGVKGFVLKTQGAEDLLRAIEAVRDGVLYVSPGASQAVVDAWRGAGEAQLSPRERQVLQLIAEGKTSAEAAKLLFLSVKTVETYRSRFMQKLGLKDMTALVKFAIQHGIISLEQ